MRDEQIIKTEGEQSKELEKLAFLVSEQYMELLPNIEVIPDLLQLVIENYNLDCTNLSKNELMDFGIAYQVVFSVLRTVQNILWDYSEKIKAVDYKESLRDLKKFV